MAQLSDVSASPGGKQEPASWPVPIYSYAMYSYSPASAHQDT